MLSSGALGSSERPLTRKGWLFEAFHRSRL